MPQRIAGTMARNEATTTKAIAGLPSVDFQVPIPDCWCSVIDRISDKAGNRQLPIGEIRLATGLLRGKERVGKLTKFEH